MAACLDNESERLGLLYRVGVALSAERNRDRLIEMILIEAKRLCCADGGTLYLREDDKLRFAIMRTDSLGIALGGSTGRPIEQPPIYLADPVSGIPNHKNVATHTALVKHPVDIPDAYDAEGFDFSGTKIFDESNGYRSTSFLTVPLVNNEGYVIAVLQLINAQDPLDGRVVPFCTADLELVVALASQASVALENQILLEDQRELLEAFIELMAKAIDSKSPYTGAHCARVPVLALMLAEAACNVGEGPLAGFSLSDEEWYELKIAAWLHDCGKVTTPVHVMDKATKLETIFDRIHLIEARFEVLARDARIQALEAKAAGDNDADMDLEQDLATLVEELEFLRRANVGTEFLAPEDREKIRRIGSRRYVEGGVDRPLLDEDELENLIVAAGTLNPAERLIINGHMVQTIEMLESLPFPRHLRHVLEYAGAHHEKMDGSGYPRGQWVGDLPIPARIMAIADVFEALTAQDRPYKKGKTLSQAMRIMGAMKRSNHLDPDLFDLFVRSKAYRTYGERFLPVHLIDDVDEDVLLAIEPKPYELPPKTYRDTRRNRFLPKYEPLRTSVTGEPTIIMKPMIFDDERGE